MADQKYTPFDYIGNIITKGQKIPDDGYAPFLVNRGLSYNKVCVFWANEMNQRPNLDKDIQYEFLYRAVTKGKQTFSKWAKPDKSDENLQLISEYYQVNLRRAKEILTLINTEEIEALKQMTFKGGKQ